MRFIIRYVLMSLLVFPSQVKAQDEPLLSLDTIIQRVSRNNILLQSYELKAEGYRYSADAATAWMAPMVGVGTFMTPYPGQEIMDERDKGSMMLELEQQIPNPAKLKAKRQYIASLGNVERAGRAVTLNDFKAQTRRLYFNWLIARQRIAVFRESEKIMVTMKKIEELRYPYNQSQLSGVFKATAKIEENNNMIIMQQGLIAKSRAWLNSLMNEPVNNVFNIDSSYHPAFVAALSYDSISLASSRKDILKMDESIHSMQLNIKSMKREKAPDFKIRYDHMAPFGKMMPNAYSVMGIISIPIAPWSSRMYSSGIRSMQYNVQAMEKERTAMIRESQGMLYGMQYEIQSMQTRIDAMQQKIIPALQQTLDANFLNYQENKLTLSNVIDSWEALTMMQTSVLDEQLKLYEMIVEYEKQLYR